MRNEKGNDKLKQSDDTIMVIYDLENVITLPKAEVGIFFYKRKLTVYNLTAQTSSKQGYCSIWHELQSGNDIASSFITILHKIILDYPEVKHLICWSDSCVPQNRNSHNMAHAIQEFVDNCSVESVTLKYSIGCHGCVQEVDNMHKQIEDAMNVVEFYSPLSFVRLLLNVNRVTPYRIIQMNENHFKDYANSAKVLRYSLVPFSKIVQLRIRRDDPYTVDFKLSHDDRVFTSVHVGTGTHTRRSSFNQSASVSGSKIDLRKLKESSNASINILKSRIQRNTRKLDDKKKKDLEEMMKFMPLIDRKYYGTLGCTEK